MKNNFKTELKKAAVLIKKSDDIDKTLTEIKDLLGDKVINTFINYQIKDNAVNGDLFDVFLYKNGKLNKTYDCIKKEDVLIKLKNIIKGITGPSSHGIKIESEYADGEKCVIDTVIDLNLWNYIKYIPDSYFE